MSRSIIPSRSRRLAVVAAVFAIVLLAASPAFADHGEGHNGEAMTLSNDTDIADGETVTVELSSWLPGATMTVVTCYNYPAAGPADCELSNYGQYVVTAADDGTATIEYLVSVVPGRCDHENPCFIVAGDGIGGAANFAAVLITFAPAGSSDGTEAADAASEEPPATTAAPAEEAPAPAPTTTEEPPATTAAPAEEAPAPAPTTTEEPPATTAAPAEEAPAPAPTTTEEAPATTTAAASAEDDGSGGGSTGLIILIVVIVVVVIGVGGGVFLVRRRKS